MFVRSIVILLFSLTSLLGLALVAEPTIGAPQRELKREELVVDTRKGEVRLSTEVARTPVEQEIGLLGRKKTDGPAVMFFPKTKAEVVEVESKEGSLPVDVMFVGEDGRIKSIATLASAKRQASIRSPGKVAGYLKVSAGMAKKLGIRVGDRLRTASMSG